MKKQNETSLKSVVKDYLKLKGITCYPIMQGLGSYPGLPDMQMHFEGKIIHLEMKTPTGKLSERQLAFQEQCALDNVPYFVIRSLEDIIGIVG